MKVPEVLETPKPIMSETSWLVSFVRMLSRLYEQVSRAINGQIGFGDGTEPENINGTWVTVTTPVTPNTNFSVNHLLGHIPVGRIVMKKSAAVDIYDGTGTVDDKVTSLRATVGSVNVSLFFV